ncbi:hypothetical protein L3Y34_006519 [Caenorhabditis briggsae]|uniref:Uncharacterized protein n=1 Tax=Caenorhabditis briggsae TaxID=6238 RepID=A0AAE9CYK1_CAEBR|nr:hypothetical protein L3Y34_006519 [Caenorhabditis briggsae]
MSKDNFNTRAALFASPVNSPPSKNSNSVSPGGVPKKKVAREKPLIPPIFGKEHAPEAPEDVEDVPKAPKAPGAVEDVPEEKEPMEVDTSIILSPQKATPRRQAPATSSALNTPEASTAVKLDKLYEKLMRENEKLTAYHAEINEDMSKIREEKAIREAKLKQAEEVTSSAHISSVTHEPITVTMDLDFSIRKTDFNVTVREEEKPEEVVRRLFENFLSITGEGGEKAKMELEQSEKKIEKLKNKLKKLKAIEKENDEHRAKMDVKYQERLDDNMALDARFERLEDLKARYRPVRMDFGF